MSDRVLQVAEMTKNRRFNHRFTTPTASYRATRRVPRGLALLRALRLRLAAESRPIFARRNSDSANKARSRTDPLGRICGRLPKLASHSRVHRQLTRWQDQRKSISQSASAARTARASLPPGTFSRCIFARRGLHLNAYNAYQSIIRGGHTFLTIRAGDGPVRNMGDKIDVFIPLNQDTMDRHLHLLKSRRVRHLRQGEGHARAGGGRRAALRRCR